MKTQWCVNCWTIGRSCCEAAKARGEDANTLAKLVSRQSEVIVKISRERDEARQVIADLRAKGIEVLEHADHMAPHHQDLCEICGPARAAFGPFAKAAA